MIFKFSNQVLTAADKAEQNIQAQFQKIEQAEQYNQQKVLAAFIANRVGTQHFTSTNGYGYGDAGRDLLDRVFADVFGAEDALVRHNFVSGTHAIVTALFGVLRPGDVLISAAGKPYDTLEETLGLRGKQNGSLREWGVETRQIDLLPSGQPDLKQIAAAVQAPNAKVLYIQRSRGYSLRTSIHIDEIKMIINAAKAQNPSILVLVDNCYGEFVETREPIEAGADLIIGSLIKNPGGGLAQTGGYIAGRADLIEQCAYRLTAPGVGREVGASLGQSRSMYMGLFSAPHVTAQALKTAVFAAALFEELGFEASPGSREPRTDIVQSIALRTPQNLKNFCRGIQKSSPVDSAATPEPWDMPGYDSQVIMAAGAFTMGASIELSADAPLREPYAVWVQGGLTYYSGKAGIMTAAEELLKG